MMELTQSNVVPNMIAAAFDRGRIFFKCISNIRKWSRRPCHDCSDTQSDPTELPQQRVLSHIVPLSGRQQQVRDTTIQPLNQSGSEVSRWV